MRTPFFSFICLLLSLSAQPVYAGEKFVPQVGTNLAKEYAVKSSGENLMLNGFSVYHQWGDDVYLGALYTANVSTSAKMLLLNNDPIAMAFYFLVDDISPEMLSQIFVEGIVANNPDINQREFDLQRLNEFKQLLTQGVNAGDSFIFEYSPKTQALTLLVNGVSRHAWPRGKSFFNVLLNMWVGTVPPSYAFKQAILHSKVKKI